MTDFLKMVMVAIGVLSLSMGVRFAVFVPLHNETMAVKVPAPIAPADKACAAIAVEMPCLQHANQRS